MNRSLLFTLIVVVTAVSLAVVFLYGELYPSKAVLRGSLFVSGSGRSHGGFEYNAEWNATLTVEGTTVTLGLVLHVGLGDIFDKHEYRIESFSMDSSTVNIITPTIFPGLADTYYVELRLRT